MKTLTTASAVEWVRSTGLRAGIKRDNDVQSPDDTLDFTVAVPQGLPYQVPFLANSLLPRSHDEKLEPFLFWITDNGAMGPFSFNLGCLMIELFRTAHGEQRPILETPAYVFGSGEDNDACMIATMALLFSWSAYFVPQHGRYFIALDDDNFVNVRCRNKEDYVFLKTRFSQWGHAEGQPQSQEI
jgi:hypothetical protein